MSDFVTMTDLQSALVEIKLLRSEVKLLREEKQKDKRSIQILRMAMVNNAIRVQLDLFSTMQNFERNNVLAPHRCGAYPITDRVANDLLLTVGLQENLNDEEWDLNSNVQSTSNCEYTSIDLPAVMNGNNFSTKLHKKKLGGEICIAKKCKDPADFAGFCGHDVFCLQHAKERVSIAWKKIQCPTCPLCGQNTQTFKNAKKQDCLNF
uniref:Uncharacterized protein n=1 Tax=Meloidogyne floridensis TaxID=298350 RepID=A0A915P232_9BILA